MSGFGLRIEMMGDVLVPGRSRTQVARRAPHRALGWCPRPFWILGSDLDVPPKALYWTDVTHAL